MASSIIKEYAVEYDREFLHILTDDDGNETGESVVMYRKPMTVNAYATNVAYAHEFAKRQAADTKYMRHYVTKATAIRSWSASTFKMRLRSMSDYELKIAWACLAGKNEMPKSRKAIIQQIADALEAM